MKLILEGIDGAGKSSILKALNAKYGVEVKELGKPPKGVTPHQWSDVFREAYDTQRLMSRCHVSEIVYGTLIRGKSLIDPWQHWLLTMQLQIKGWRIAYIRADHEQLKRRVLSRGAEASDYDLWVVKHLDQMETVYDAALPTDLTTDVFNADGHLGATVESCDAIIQSQGCENQLLLGIGSPSAKVVVVGDELTRRRWSFPHAKPFDFGEAAKMVHAALGHRHDIYLTNSKWPDLGEIRSQFQLDAELKCFPTARVITLGNEAMERCAAVGRNSVAIAHPQYWRRFKYHSQEEWVSSLKEEVDRE